MEPRRCATCGAPRTVEQRRQSFGANAVLHMSQMLPSTEGAAEMCPQILIGFHAYRNGGTDERTHMCDGCVRLSLVEIQRQVSRLLGDETMGPSPDPHLSWVVK